MSNELPSLVTIQKIRPLQHSLTSRTHILLGGPENHACFVLWTDSTTVRMNDLQPHTKLAGRPKAVQLGKVGASHTFWVPHSLFKSPGKVTKPNTWQNILLLQSPINSEIPIEFSGISSNQLLVQGKHWDFKSFHRVTKPKSKTGFRSHYCHFLAVTLSALLNECQFCLL